MCTLYEETHAVVSMIKI
ncbi:hypothetical protein [African swine fever virus]